MIEELDKTVPSLNSEKEIKLDLLLPEVLRTLKERAVPDGLSPETTRFLEEVLAAFLEQVELRAKEMAKQGRKSVRKALLGDADMSADDSSSRAIENIEL
jgi:hypothetical protein